MLHYGYFGSVAFLVIILLALDPLVRKTYKIKKPLLIKTGVYIGKLKFI